MIHGHAKIELTDVNTHEVQVYEHDNYLTNWIRDIMTPSFGILSWNLLQTIGNTSWKNTDLFGGVVLFEDALDNDANNYKFPSNNKMIARGIFDKAYNGVDTTLGSYNSSLSSTDSDTQITLIWDFSLDKGNGTISSLGLCNRWGASIGNGVSSNSIYDYNQRVRSDILGRSLQSSNLTMGAFYLDNAKDSLCVVRYSGNSTKKLVINKYFAGFSTYNPMMNKIYNIDNQSRPFLNLNSDTLIDTVEIDISSLSDFDFSHTSYGFYMASDAIYFTGNSDDWADGTTRNIFKLETPSLTISTITMTNNTGKTILMRGGPNYDYSKFVYGVHNGYFYGQTLDHKYVYVSLSDGTDCGVVTDLLGNDLTNNASGNTKAYTYSMLSHFGDLYIQTEAYGPSGNSHVSGYWKLYSKDKVTKTGLDTSMTNLTCFGSIYINQFRELMFGENSSNALSEVVINPMCLTTKCNLDSPITKTSSQTMRVTYTIQSDNS